MKSNEYEWTKLQFYRAVMSSDGSRLMVGAGDRGPGCNDSVLAKETSLPRPLSPGEREVIVRDDATVVTIVEFTGRVGT